MTRAEIPDQPVFTLAEVARLTGLTLRSLQEAAKKKRIPHRWFGRQRVMTRQHLEQFLDEIEVVPESAERQATAEEMAEEAELERVRRRVAARRQRAGVR